MIKIYHNPRGQKSREALKIIQASGEKFEIIAYLENTLSKKELRKILTRLGISAIDLVRKNEAIWKDNFKDKKLSEEELIEMLCHYPKLIQRPIIINETKAVIGRTPIRVSALI